MNWTPAAITQALNDNNVRRDALLAIDRAEAEIGNPPGCPGFQRAVNGAQRAAMAASDLIQRLAPNNPVLQGITFPVAFIIVLITYGIHQAKIKQRRNPGFKAACGRRAQAGDNDPRRLGDLLDSLDTERVVRPEDISPRVVSSAQKATQINVDTIRQVRDQQSSIRAMEGEVRAAASKVESLNAALDSAAADAQAKDDKIAALEAALADLRSTVEQPEGNGDDAADGPTGDNNDSDDVEIAVLAEHGLSAGTLEILTENGVNTIGDLRGQIEDGLEEVNGIGPAKATEIMTALTALVAVSGAGVVSE